MSNKPKLVGKSRALTENILRFTGVDPHVMPEVPLHVSLRDATLLRQFSNGGERRDVASVSIQMGIQHSWQDIKQHVAEKLGLSIYDIEDLWASEPPDVLLPLLSKVQCLRTDDVALVSSSSPVSSSSLDRSDTRRQKRGTTKASALPLVAHELAEAPVQELDLPRDQTEVPSALVNRANDDDDEDDFRFNSRQSEGPLPTLLENSSRDQFNFSSDKLLPATPARLASGAVIFPFQRLLLGLAPVTATSDIKTNLPLQILPWNKLVPWK
jgi:hypothetical protein